MKSRWTFVHAGTLHIVTASPVIRPRSTEYRARCSCGWHTERPSAYPTVLERVDAHKEGNDDDRSRERRTYPT